MSLVFLHWSSEFSFFELPTSLLPLSIRRSLENGLPPSKVRIGRAGEALLALACVRANTNREGRSRNGLSLKRPLDGRGAGRADGERRAVADRAAEMHVYP